MLSKTVTTILIHMFKKQCSQDSTAGTMTKLWAYYGLVD